MQVCVCVLMYVCTYTLWPLCRKDSWPNFPLSFHQITIKKFREPGLSEVYHTSNTACKRHTWVVSLRGVHACSSTSHETRSNVNDAELSADSCLTHQWSVFKGAHLVLTEISQTNHRNITTICMRRCMQEWKRSRDACSCTRSRNAAAWEPCWSLCSWERIHPCFMLAWNVSKQKASMDTPSSAKKSKQYSHSTRTVSRSCE